MNAAGSPYRGSPKHKNRPALGAKGTLCPEWTHSEPTRLDNDPFTHDWSQTAAHRLFQDATPHPDGLQRCYATERSIAFEAKPSNDGTWHGYPIPWESVPSAIVDQWLAEGTISKRDVKKYWSRTRDDTHWALEIEP